MRLYRSNGDSQLVRIFCHSTHRFLVLDVRCRRVVQTLTRGRRTPVIFSARATWDSHGSVVRAIRAQSFELDQLLTHTSSLFYIYSRYLDLFLHS